MTQRRNEIRRDLAGIERDLGNPKLTWNGVEIVCSPSSFEEGLEIEVGGRLYPVTAIVLVRADLFPTAPRPGNHLTFRGKLREVLSAKLSASESHYTLKLTDPQNPR
ncbi:MAG TPA: hypothetical protein VNO50_10940 [Pyrinomonadaceae bacterium]|nr:hypothetical protein [Pyrinomonadaceae bacterium]